MAAPKKWLSYADQISHLQTRGLIIDDEADAEKILSSVGYYRLSGYAYSFRIPDEKANKKALSRRLSEFQKNSYFTDIAALYRFDQALRLLVLSAMEIIEPAMQTKIAYHLGKLNPLAHEMQQFWDKNSLRKTHKGKSQYDEWQAKYRECVKRSDRVTFVKHNLKEYGCLPIWVAIEVFDFGTLSKLYTGLKDQDRLKITQPFGIDGDILRSWLRGLNFIRNMAAHHMRLWNCNVLEPVSVPAALSHLAQLDNTRPFLYFCLIQKLLKQLKVKQNNWGRKFKQLLANFPEPANQAVSLEAMGAVKGWQNWDLWK